MRTQNVQAKITDEVAIPDELIAFFRDVDTSIKRGDDSTIIESDDLIQTDLAYGGLIEESGKHFSFTYFPQESIRPTWTMELTASEIAEIAEGNLKSLILWKCQTPDCEYFFSSEKEHCFDCDYIDDELNEKQQLLKALSSCSTREEWVKGYLQHFPNAYPLEIIGAYNSQPRLGQQWGFFSLNDMQKLMEMLEA